MKKAMRTLPVLLAAASLMLLADGTDKLNKSANALRNAASAVEQAKGVVAPRAGDVAATMPPDANGAGAAGPVGYGVARGAAASTAQIADSNSNGAVPLFDLPLFPGTTEHYGVLGGGQAVRDAKLKTRIPISTVYQHPKNGWTADFMVPFEGESWYRRANYPRGDAVQIRQHYERMLAERGFELIHGYDCDLQCNLEEVVGTPRPLEEYFPVIQANLNTGLVIRMPTAVLESRYTIYSNRKTGMVLLGTKQMKSGEAIVDLYVAKGRILDASPFAKLEQAQPVGRKLELAKAVPEAVQVFDGNIRLLRSSQASALLEHTRGPLVLLFSSYDTNCGYCVRGSVGYQALAAQYGRQVQFVMAHWEPWSGFAADPLAQRYEIKGVPTALLFEDGKLIQQVNGEWSAAVLAQKLFTGTPWMQAAAPVAPMPGVSLPATRPAAPVTAPAALPAVSPLAQPFADGAELVGKIDNIKLYQAAGDDAQVLALLSRQDGLVFMGVEQGGRLKVVSDQGEGWVDKRVVKLR
ncbi:thioredoxin family protein [Chitinimonas sp.]|uniref:thioredoxin family protein n=1 Tax=Chitinimonas sp. TaxID=1934313 RepID=UPI002F92BDFC